MSDIHFDQTILKGELTNCLRNQDDEEKRYQNQFLGFEEERGIRESGGYWNTEEDAQKGRRSQMGGYKRPAPLTISRGQFLGAELSNSSLGARNRWKEALQSKRLHTVFDITDSDKFQCKNCELRPDPQCQICKGRQQVGGESSLIKFFDYIIAFKMGSKESYKPIRPSNFASQLRSTTNNFRSDFFPERIKQANIRNSEGGQRLTTKTKRWDKQQLAQQLNTMKIIHQNYICDQCQVTPIVGPRFHCIQCQDYDQCQECNLRKGHCHKMEKIENCPKRKQLESIAHLLAYPLVNLPKISVKLPISRLNTSEKLTQFTRNTVH